MQWQWLFPFLSWRDKVTTEALRSDVIAGFVGAVIVFPQGIAFATIAGLPPHYGLYAAIVPAIIAALWGSSWHLVSGPTTAISLVVFSSLSPLATPGSERYVALALTVAAMAGLMQFVLGIFRFGMLVRLISPTVVVGFTAGAGLLIATNQLKNASGIAVPSGSSFFETWEFVLSNLMEVNPFIISVVIVTLVVGLLFKYAAPKFPYMIPALVVGSLSALALNHFFGADVTGIKTVGAMPVSLPPLSFPVFDAETLRVLPGVALAITLLGLTEAVAISRSVANRSGQRIDSDQEFIGQGLSNMVGSFFSSYPTSGSFNRSGLNYEAGAKTPLASVFAAFFLIILILVLSPLAAYMPFAVMAAVLFLVAYGIIDIPHIKHILKGDKTEVFLLVITFLATLLLELESAIFIGVILAMAFFLRRVMFANVAEVGESEESHTLKTIDETCDAKHVSGVLIVRVDMSIVYMNCDLVFERIMKIKKLREQCDCGPIHTLILNFSGVNYVDIVGLDALRQFVHELEKEGVYLGIVSVKKPIRKMLTEEDLLSHFTYYKNIDDLHEDVEKRIAG